MAKEALVDQLNELVLRYNNPSFIGSDPILIPHQYSLKQDIEITAFWTAMLAWGQRKTIINKANELFGLMDNAPYDFIKNHQEHDRKRFSDFKHRTFQFTDTLYFLERLQMHYQQHDSLESAFANGEETEVREVLINFHNNFFNLPYAPHRTRKHVSTPERKSTCKRLNMFLRWMVRKDNKGVDFGIWNNIKMSQLMVPYDVHVERVSHRLNLINRKQRDWKTVEALMEVLRQFDPEDPAKYDYALFGMGVLES